MEVQRRVVGGDEDRIAGIRPVLKPVASEERRVRDGALAVEHRAPLVAGADCDERREAMLGDELIAIAEIMREVSADAFGVCHQHVDEVVDYDGDVDAIDRLELYGLASET